MAAPSVKTVQSRLDSGKQQLETSEDILTKTRFAMARMKREAGALQCAVDAAQKYNNSLLQAVKDASLFHRAFSQMYGVIVSSAPHLREECKRLAEVVEVMKDSNMQTNALADSLKVDYIQPLAKCVDEWKSSNNTFEKHVLGYAKDGTKEGTRLVKLAAKLRKQVDKSVESNRSSEKSMKTVERLSDVMDEHDRHFVSYCERQKHFSDCSIDEETTRYGSVLDCTEKLAHAHYNVCKHARKFGGWLGVERALADQDGHMASDKDSYITIEDETEAEESDFCMNKSVQQQPRADASNDSLNSIRNCRVTGLVSDEVTSSSNKSFSTDSIPLSIPRTNNASGRSTMLGGTPAFNDNASKWSAHGRSSDTSPNNSINGADGRQYRQHSDNAGGGSGKRMLRASTSSSSLSPSTTHRSFSTDNLSEGEGRGTARGSHVAGRRGSDGCVEDSLNTSGAGSGGRGSGGRGSGGRGSGGRGSGGGGIRRNSHERASWKPLLASSVVDENDVPSAQGACGSNDGIFVLPPLAQAEEAHRHLTDLMSNNEARASPVPVPRLRTAKGSPDVSPRVSRRRFGSEGSEQTLLSVDKQQQQSHHHHHSPLAHALSDPGVQSEEAEPEYDAPLSHVPHTRTEDRWEDQHEEYQQAYDEPDAAIQAADARRQQQQARARQPAPVLVFDLMQDTEQESVVDATPPPPPPPMEQPTQPNAVAVKAYRKKLEDELDLVPGDRIIVLTSADDGWVRGTSVRTGITGWFHNMFIQLDADAKFLVAAMDFAPTANNQKNVLALQCGERVRVLDQSNKVWWLVNAQTTTNGSSTGFVPAQCLKPESSPKKEVSSGYSSGWESSDNGSPRAPRRIKREQKKAASLKQTTTPAAAHRAQRRADDPHLVAKSQTMGTSSANNTWAKWMSPTDAQPKQDIVMPEGTPRSSKLHKPSLSLQDMDSGAVQHLQRLVDEEPGGYTINAPRKSSLRRGRRSHEHGGESSAPRSPSPPDETNDDEFVGVAPPPGFAPPPMGF